MRISILRATALGLSLLVFGSVIKADDLEELKKTDDFPELKKADDLEELKKKVVAVQKEAAELREKGQKEEAEMLEREAEKLMLEARRLFEEKNPEGKKVNRQKEPRQNHPEIQQLKERLQDLRGAMKKAEVSGASEEEKNELREQIHQTEQKLAHMTEHLGQQPGKEIPPQFRERAEKIEMAARRIKHVQAAAENLKAAEMHDMAQELMKTVETMEHELHGAKAELAKEMQAALEHREPKNREPEHRDEPQDLKAENERLRQELNELRKAVEHLRGERERE